jgi:hypothetical protein
MPDREKSTLHHLEPTFLRGAFLRRWDSVSEDLQPPSLESWAGPWQALRRNGDTKALWPWEVRRSWQTNGHGEPAGAFLLQDEGAAEAAPYQLKPDDFCRRVRRNGGVHVLKRRLRDSGPKVKPLRKKITPSGSPPFPGRPLLYALHRRG